MSAFFERIECSCPTHELMEKICEAYGVGKMQSFAPIEVGYEDCNVRINTDQGSFLAKIFAKFRKPDETARCIDIMQKVCEAGIQHPKVLDISRRKLLEMTNIDIVLMEFVEGKTFYEMGRIPDETELEEIIEQAAKINAMDFKPTFLFDSWAVQNLPKLFEQVKEFVGPKDLGLIEKIVDDFSRIPMDKLPHAFVHGDLIGPNLIKGKDKVYIIDFSVANWYPRIQEVALIATHLTDKRHGSIAERAKYVADIYSKFLPLEDIERQYLVPYIGADIVSELLSAYRERHIKGNKSAENNYWLEFGLKGLRDNI